jgi:AraC-like DNA-binding protein
MPLPNTHPHTTRSFQPAPASSPKRATRRFTHAHRQRLERAIKHYVKDCYKRVTSARVSECAAFVGVSVPYLSRIAPEILGMPLLNHLRQHQIAYAVQLLRTTPLHAEEIAVRAAFGSVPTFYRWFQAIHGMTPAAFREVMK